MTFAFRLRQALLIARLELGRAFFSKRAFWVYGLALFPLLIFVGHGLDATWKRQRWAEQITTRQRFERYSPTRDPFCSNRVFLVSGYPALFTSGSSGSSLTMFWNVSVLLRRRTSNPASTMNASDALNRQSCFAWRTP